MTKEGTNRHSHGLMTDQDYHKELNHDLQHFLKDLRVHKQSLQGTLDEHAMISMERFSGLVLASVQEIKRSGIAKEGKIFQHAFMAYKNDPSDEHYSALENAVVTLQEFNC